MKSQELRERTSVKRWLSVFQTYLLIWNDETTFWINKSCPSHAWVVMGYEDQEEPFEGKSSLHGTKLHIWGAISSAGTVSLSIFEKNMNGDIYRDIIGQKTMR